MDLTLLSLSIKVFEFDLSLSVSVCVSLYPQKRDKNRSRRTGISKPIFNCRTRQLNESTAHIKHNCNLKKRGANYPRKT